MTARQRSRLVRYLAAFAVAALSWEALALVEAERVLAAREVVALRDFRIPLPDAYMIYLGWATERSGLAVAAAFALALACLAAYCSGVKGKVASACFAAAVGAYALLGMDVAVPVSGLAQIAMGDAPLIPFSRSVPPLIDLGSLPGDVADAEGFLEAAGFLLVLSGRLLAIAISATLLWDLVPGRKGVARA